ASNTDTRVPSWVSYEMSAADMAVQGKTQRDSRFRTDPSQPGLPVTDDEYVALNRARATPQDSTPSDRGHMKEPAASPNAEAMSETFNLSNIAPQYANFNQGAWRYLEEATRELVQASGGNLSVFTGNLYLDKDGRPLPPEQLDRQKTG